MKLHQRIGILVSLALFPLVWWGWYRFHVVVFSVDISVRDNVYNIGLWSFVLTLVTSVLVCVAIAVEGD